MVKKPPSTVSPDDRRERVLELFSKRDRRIAEILMAEGFFGKVPEGDRNAGERLSMLLLAKRTVNRDRQAILAEQKKRQEDTKQDPATASYEYIVRLQSRINDLDDVLADSGSRSTAKVMALGEIRQLEHLIAKARGVDEGVKDDGDSDNRSIVVGLHIGTKELKPEDRERLRAQGIEIGDE